MKRVLVYIKNISFQRKLFLSYLLIVIIPISVIGLYAYQQAGENILQQKKSDILKMTSSIVDDIEYRLTKYNNMIQLFSLSTRVNQIYNTKYENFYNLNVDYSEAVSQLIGTLICINNDLKSIKIYTDNASFSSEVYSIYLTDSMKKENWYKETRDSIKVKWFIKDNNILGVGRFSSTERNNDTVVLQPAYKKLFTMMDNLDPSEYIVNIIDKDDNLVYTNSDHLEKRNIDVKNKENLSVLRIDENDYYIVKKDIPSASWTMVCYIPTDVITSSSSPILSATILLILSCFILLILLIWVFTSMFVKRIRLLNEKVEMVSAGNLKQEISSDIKDEIGNFTNSFGHMLKNLNHMIDEITQSKIRQKESELKLLQAQINPHFLYNSLSIISWKAIMIRSFEISDLVSTISKYYRTTLNKGNTIISIRDEISNIKAYIDIQLVMHYHSFDVEYDIDESIYGYYMINTILQPIVENAIGHGIDVLESTRGFLRVSAHCEEKSIRFLISDNGNGMSEDTLNRIFIDQSMGYGLKNVQERIRLQFGDEYGLEISSEPGNGTRVRIIIPKFSANIIEKT